MASSFPKAKPIDPKDLYVSGEAVIADVVAAIDRAGRAGIALLVDAQERLVNTFTDGDVRRGLLRGLNLTDRALRLLEIKNSMPRPVPVVGGLEHTQEQRIAIMRKHAVRGLPILDRRGRVRAVDSLHHLLDDNALPLNAVVMAGGLGKRLHPLTIETPKPMLHVRGRPVLEHIVQRLARAGIHKLNFTTCFRPEKIMEHFGDGREFGVDVTYTNEDSPLGTAGALGMMEKPAKDVLVVNGDVISEVDFVSMFDYHRESRSVMTLGVLPYEHTVPYGVVEFDGQRVSQFLEKPTQRWCVNGGIYILAPHAFEYLTRGERMDMPDLINRLIAAGEHIASFPIREQWIDIGQPADYARAQGAVAVA